MNKDLRALPLFVYILFISGLGMFVPALYALRFAGAPAAPAFALNGFLVVVVTTIIALSLRQRKPRSTARLHLITLLGTYFILPAIAAVPFDAMVGSIAFPQAYFEMLSALTTTGATLFEDPSTISAPLHLWRGLVAWFGGFVILVAAYAIMEPLNLGGFEVRAAFSGAQPGTPSDRRQYDDASDRIIRVVRTVAPIYVALTLALTVGLVLLGDRVFVAFMHAMGILSTSGISPVGGLTGGAVGWLGEAVMAVFLLTALTHTTVSRFSRGEDARNPLRDPEVQLAAILIVGVSTLLFLRHFIGAIEVGGSDDPATAFRAFWGAVFTALSYLTTTGYASIHWGEAQGWSGLPTSGLILLAFAIVGGGIATTAGGVKLLRFFALYKHGMREMGRLVHPNSIGASGRAGRRIRREGAYIAWMFLMLFFLSVAGAMLALTLTGVDFESAVVLSVAALSNTGPLATAVGDNITGYALLSDNARIVLGAVMILGRMEALAVIALLNPEYWRS